MNCSLNRASWNVSQFQYLVGNHSGGKVKTGAVSGLSAAVNIQPTGSRMKRLATMSRAYTNTACNIRGSRGKRGEGGPRPVLPSVRCNAVLCTTRAIVLVLRLVEDEAPLCLHHYEHHDHAYDREDHRERGPVAHDPLGKRHPVQVQHVEEQRVLGPPRAPAADEHEQRAEDQEGVYHRIEDQEEYGRGEQRQRHVPELRPGSGAVYGGRLVEMR